MMDDSLHRFPLEDILNLTTDAIIIIDESRRIAVFNQGASRMFGYTSHEALGQPLDLLIPNLPVDSRGHHIVDFAAEMSTRPSIAGQYCEVLGRRKDGSEFPAEAAIVKLASKGQTCFTVLLHDISERKHVETRLRQAEERYRLLIDGIQDYAIYMLDPGGHIVSWNVGAERMTGYHAHEIIGRHFACFFTDEDTSARKPDHALRTAIANGRYEDEGWRVRKDGSNFWANVIITAVRDEQDQLRGFAEVIHDSTERRRADEALRRYAHQLHVLYEISQAILVAQSPRAIAQATLHQTRRLVPCRYAHVISVSETDAAASLAICDMDDTLKDSLDLCTDNVTSLSLVDPLQEGRVTVISLDDQDTMASVFLPFRAAGLRWLIIAPLVAHDVLIGELALASDDSRARENGYLDIVRQIADQLAVALQHARLFEEVQRSRNQLQGLSHRLIEVQETERRTIARELHDEIGQALTLVKMNLQAARRYASGAEVEMHLSECISTAERALEQVRNLSLDLRPSLLDDLGLVAALRWYVARQARIAGFVLHFSVEELDERLTPTLETSCFRVAQEALTNVVRHARAREVWFELRVVDEHELSLTIRDDGVGFDVSQAQSRASLGGSFGILGMYERVRIVGGHLTMVSSPGQGTHLCARFPLQMLPMTR
jgi:PAS domain S-box-containing protein